MTALILLISAFLTLTPLSEEGLEQLIDDHKGQVLVVNFWATWCGPCRDEFPDLVKLFDENNSRGLDLASISMDEPEDAESALQFLEKQRVEFQTFIRDFEDFNQFVEKIDPGWSGALPATFVFDREGKRVFSHVGVVTYSELAEVVRPLF
jgi:thiol-disulfide isomerase/thioredoxin